MKSIADEALEISNILAVSHASTGGNVALIRSGRSVLSPSAYSTINALNPQNKVLQTSLLDLIGNGDGGKTATFILTSLLRSFQKTPHHLRHELKREILEASKSIRIQPLKQNRGALLALSEPRERPLSENLIRAVYMSNGGHVSLEKSDSVDTIVEQTDSLRTELNTRWIDGERTFKGPMIALTSNMLSDVESARDFMENMGAFEGRPLIVVSPIVGRDVVNLFELNNREKTLECCVVEAPRVTWAKGWMDDLAAFTGATVYDKNLHGEFKPLYYGSAMEIQVRHGEMIVDPYEDHAEGTASRADLLLNEARTTPHPYTQDLWKKRAAALMGNLVRVRVGGTTEIEARVRRNYAEKILISMSDIYRNGYVPGIIPTLARLNTTSEVLNKALKSPWMVLCHNNGTAMWDISVLDTEEAVQPFPFGRLSHILNGAVSVAITLGMSELTIINGRIAT